MPIRTKALLIGSTVGLAFGLAFAGAPAMAQDYGNSYESYDTSTYYSGPPEEVIVTPPRHRPERSEIGAPIEYVSMSRAVPTDDLDLRTGWGVRELKRRIDFTAVSLCSRLDAAYPIDVDNVTWPSDARCYRNAVRDAEYQADRAIRAARGYGGYYQ